MELAELGITVDCAPVLDLSVPGAHDVIGDRAFDRDPAVIAALGAAACAGLRDAGVMPVIKHIPGHGRAAVDSHLGLPTVDAPLDLLETSDFEPFRRVAGGARSDRCWAMTAHIVFRAIDPRAPVTLSAPAIERIVRSTIGFDGVLVSDDLSMQALRGDLESRAAGALAAGCDVVLHCNGDMDEMRAVARATGPLSRAARARLERATAMLPAPDALDRGALGARLDGLLAAA
jgi:beta-N-acetylhexosaminidase